MSFFNDYEKEFKSCKRKIEEKNWKIKELENQIVSLKSQIVWHEETLNKWKLFSKTGSFDVFDFTGAYLRNKFNR